MNLSLPQSNAIIHVINQLYDLSSYPVQYGRSSLPIASNTEVNKGTQYTVVKVTYLKFPKKGHHTDRCLASHELPFPKQNFFDIEQ